MCPAPLPSALRLCPLPCASALCPPLPCRMTRADERHWGGGGRWPGPGSWRGVRPAPVRACSCQSARSRGSAWVCGCRDARGGAGRSATAASSSERCAARAWAHTPHSPVPGHTFPTPMAGAHAHVYACARVCAHTQLLTRSVTIRVTSNCPSHCPSPCPSLKAPHA